MQLLRFYISICSPFWFRCIGNDESSSNLATASKKEGITPNKKKSENVDLFAVDDRASVKDGVNLAPTETIPADVKLAGLPIGQFSNRSYIIEQQAEFLRLEAEKEQIQIDALRIEAEKVLFGPNLIFPLFVIKSLQF